MQLFRNRLFTYKNYMIYILKYVKIWKQQIQQLQIMETSRFLIKIILKNKYVKIWVCIKICSPIIQHSMLYFTKFKKNVQQKTINIKIIILFYSSIVNKKKIVKTSNKAY